LFMPLAEAAAKRHDVSSALVKAVIWKESRWLPTVVGRHGEIGLMQIMPGAVEDWQRLNKQATPTRSDLFKPELNIEIGTWYLSWTGNHWQGYKAREILQLAEYNAGYNRVSKLWKPDSPEQDLPLEKISFPGTRDYIKQILERKVYYENQEHANNKDPSQPGQP
jgi:soluble lytic murein transglycosylase